jgi:hypothetical protein
LAVAAGAAVDPGDGGTSVLGPRDVEGGGRRVGRYDGAAGPGQQEGQAAGTAADVEDPVRAQFGGDGDVGGQVVARAVEGVVDPRQAGMREDRVGHTTTVSVAVLGAAWRLISYPDLLLGHVQAM